MRRILQGHHLRPRQSGRHQHATAEGHQPPGGVIQRHTAHLHGQRRPRGPLHGQPARHEPKLDVRPEPKSEQKPQQSGLKSQDFYDNLEEEMASLLGRPSGKS